MNMTMKNYSSGWIDSSIHQFLSEIQRHPTSMTYALITCIDSCFDVSSMMTSSSGLSKLNRDAKCVGKGVVVPTKKLLSIDRDDRIFFGFDEVWFFPQARVSPKPDNICLTGPSEQPIDLSSNIVTWMSRNKCTLGLGDGTGLNFVARFTGIAKYIVNEWGASMRRPEPA
jgi:hypothetical protein